MRLYHVEPFYAFLLCFHNEGSEEEGRPAPMQGQPEKEASGARKGRQSPAGTTASSAMLAKEATYRVPARGCRPRPFLPLAGSVAPAAGVAAPWQGDY
ncbi:hypothetical protein GW17_00054115 [Ensete ventricosum]|nr:hypothetical protein GW17_00054115 [Ensete ventricosum]